MQLVLWEGEEFEDFLKVAKLDSQGRGFEHQLQVKSLGKCMDIVKRLS